MTVSFGIKLPGLIPRYARTLADLPDLAVELERLGADDVMDGEHIFFGPVMHHPGGSGNMVMGRDHQQSDRSDALVMFAAMAARTTTLKFFSSVILAAGHRFAVLARQAATLDVVSRGRYVMGVGGGWFRDEFVALGIDPNTRDLLVEETVRACQELWSPGLSTFEGELIRFSNVLIEPAPVTAGGVPVWWGGDGQRGNTARRVATLGRGWIAREAATFDEVARSIENIRTACEAVGRDPSDLGFRASITPTPQPGELRDPARITDEAVASCQRLVSVGVTHFNIPLNHYGFDLEHLITLLQQLRAST